MSDWQIFCWAMLHSPEFWCCYVRSPIALGFRRGLTADGHIFWFSITFQSIGVYVPWSVKHAYYAAHGLRSDELDDIPF